MEESSINRFTPGGNPEMGNPSTFSEVAELRSDSGGGSIFLDSEKPTVGHLAVGTTPQTSSETMETDTPAGGRGPRSISSRLEKVQIDKATDDEQSLKDGSVDYMDSDAERDFLDSEADTACQEETKSKKKEITAAQKARKAYRNALSFLKKMNSKKDEELTASDRELIKVNKKKVSKFEAKHQQQKLETITEEHKVARTKPAKKLQRSNATVESPKPEKPNLPPSERKTVKSVQSSNGEESKAKKVKPSINFDLPEKRRIAIIDRSDPDGKMTAERWMEVESRILLAIAELDSDGCEEVDFDGAGWEKGVKVVGCSNRKSRDFLTQVIDGCGELWQGAQLEVIQMSQLPLRKKISLWIPPPVSEGDDTVVKILGKQNRGLKTQSWRIISSAKSQNGKRKDFVFTINGESLESLRKSKGSIKFGSDTLKARLPNDKRRPGLRVVQINLNHCEAATEDLMLLMTEKNVDVALVQEPWLAKDRVRGLRTKEYTLLHSQTAGKKRTCIVAKRSLKLTLLTQYSTNDLTVATCESQGNTKLLLASAYMPYDEAEPPPETVQNLVLKARKQVRQLVIGCDANGHQWGSKDINERGESIMDFILTNNLTICNKNNIPTFVNKVKEKVIDLTLTTGEEGLIVEDWRVSLKRSFSDHRRILFSINRAVPISKPFRNPKRTNWEMFSKLVDGGPRVQMSEYPSIEGIEILVSELEDALMRTFKKSCLVSRLRKATKPW
ncbi:uncharacterized protein LOC143907492 [Temnothorax americanus]|uniref:uncharacterized protein LOC143907492 n=1 Tax=Temnothorax americanus TaxID=1964332 RepID=UPI00406871DD